MCMVGEGIGVDLIDGISDAYICSAGSRITARHVKGSRYGRRMQMERRDLQPARNP